MTDPTDPRRGTPASDRRFVKDVARQVDSRRVRRRILLWLLLLAAIVLAIYYGTCGAGSGIGKGKGAGEGPGPGSNASALLASDAGIPRCAILLAASGITEDRVASTPQETVARCKAAGAADVIVTGDTRQGDWDALRAALEAANIAIFKREPKAGLVDAGASPGAVDVDATAPAATPGDAVVSPPADAPSD
jgi:hypothetical protein